MTQVTIHHRAVTEQIPMALGVVRANRIGGGEPADDQLAQDIDACLGARRQPLPATEEARRLACRRMLRNGRYRPSGRAKPASEYLLRAAVQGEFPRISGPVDAINLVSLQWMAPISLWDLDRAGADVFEVRLGRADEQYRFNAAGQMLALQDLVCGCGVTPGASTPIVTPIKDSLATKLRPDTGRAVACIYFPLVRPGDRADLEAMTEQLEAYLRRCGDPAGTGSAVIPPPEGVAHNEAAL